MLKSTTNDLGGVQFEVEKFRTEAESDLDKEIERTERKSKNVALAVDLFFGLGWLLTVGAKMAGTEAVIEAV